VEIAKVEIPWYMHESVYYFKHLDKCIETIIPNTCVASWFSKKDPKKAVQPAVSGDTRFVFRQYNTTPNLSEMAGPGPTRTIDILHRGEILIFGKSTILVLPNHATFSE
jgi:hypothetical protein